MKTKVATKDFKKAIRKVISILDSQEIKLNDFVEIEVKADKLTMRTNNSTQSIAASLKCETETEGGLIVSAKMLNIITGKLESETIILEETEKELILKYEENKCSIRKTEAEIPSFPEEKTILENEIEAKKLSEMLSKVTMFCNEKATNATQGINIKFNGDSIKAMAATNYMGVITETAFEKQFENKNITLNKKSAIVINELCQETEEQYITLKISDKFIQYEDKDTVFIAATISGNFPDLESVFNKRRNNAKTLERNKMIKALERINCFDSGNVPSIIVTRGNTMIMDIKSELGSNIEKITYEGNIEEKTIAMNCSYLLKALKKCKSDKVSLYINEPLSVAFLYSEDARFAITPLRVTAAQLASVA